MFLLFMMVDQPTSGQVRESIDTGQELPGAVLEWTVRALEHFATQRPQEKLYLHFDKPYYAAGADIWFRAYLVNASTHTASSISKIIQVELITPAATEDYTMVVHQDYGILNGGFNLPVG